VRRGNKNYGPTGLSTGMHDLFEPPFNKRMQLTKEGWLWQRPRS